MKEVSMEQKLVESAKQFFEIEPGYINNYRMAFNKDKAIVLEIRKRNGMASACDMDFYVLENYGDERSLRISRQYVGGIVFDVHKHYKSTTELVTIGISKKGELDLNKKPIHRDYCGFDIETYGLKFLEEVAFARGHDVICGDFIGTNNVELQTYIKNGYKVCNGLEPVEAYKKLDENCKKEIEANTTRTLDIKIYKPLCEWQSSTKRKGRSC